MILVTGAAGFIGSVMIWKLNGRDTDAIIGVDRFHQGDKWKNLRKRRVYDWVDREDLFSWLRKDAKSIDTLVHLGACTDTTERDVDYFIRNNFEYSKSLWDFCTINEIPFLYASSAATYGAGELGYLDEEERVDELRPLNPYGWSKQLFDRWALQQRDKPPFWYGFKFFNVYGPNEYHKGHMASIAYHAYNQVKDRGTIRLFKSHRADYGHGEQKRDFVYVKDVVSIMDFFLQHTPKSGLYNVGTGKARSFNDLARAVFTALKRTPSITYFDTPENLRKQYQYFTEASVEKLRTAGYGEKIHDLESGVGDYIESHLDREDPYL
jgi:ADP-L-glycero-D-manno-heptose 6-epimerase